MTDHPPLPPDVVVLPGTDLEGEWERFRIFEALHHGMRICNPMTEADLDALIPRLDPADGSRVLVRNDMDLGYNGVVTPAVIRRTILENPLWYHLEAVLLEVGADVTVDAWRLLLEVISRGGAQVDVGDHHGPDLVLRQALPVHLEGKGGGVVRRRAAAGQQQGGQTREESESTVELNCTHWGTRSVIVVRMVTKTSAVGSGRCR